MIDRIKQEYQPSDTLSTLAAKLGVSRSTISGYYHRKPALREECPLAGHNPGVKNKTRPDSVRSRRAAGLLPLKRSQQPATPVQDRTPPRALDIDADKVGAYSLIDLPANCCKWPYGHTGRFTFCGAPLTETHSKQFRMYCSEHAYRARDSRLRDNR